MQCNQWVFLKILPSASEAAAALCLSLNQEVISRQKLYFESKQTRRICFAMVKTYPADTGRK